VFNCDKTGCGRHPSTARSNFRKSFALPIRRVDAVNLASFPRADGLDITAEHPALSPRIHNESSGPHATELMHRGKKPNLRVVANGSHGPRAWPALAKMTWFPTLPSWAHGLVRMEPTVVPMIVTPPPLGVPRLIVTNSLKRCGSDLQLVGSPLYLRSCGFRPIEEWLQNGSPCRSRFHFARSHRSPVSVPPAGSERHSNHAIGADGRHCFDFRFLIQ